MNTYLENQSKISYIDLSYSSAARYNWRVVDGFVGCDGVCKVGGQLSVEKAQSKGLAGETIAGARISMESKQSTNEKSIKIALINVFHLEFGLVPALGDEFRSFA